MIIASLHTTDPHSDVDTSAHIYLGALPAPGDLVATWKGQTVRVIRRTFLDHGKDEKNSGPGSFVDVALHVRKVTDTDG